MQLHCLAEPPAGSDAELRLTGLHQRQRHHHHQVRKSASCGTGDLRGMRSRSAASGADGRKRVQFADEMGLELFQIRVMMEPSWVPPQLRLPMSILESLYKASLATPEAEAEAAAPLTQRQFMRCRFVQPAAKFDEFCSRLERDSVCLESVRFQIAEPAAGDPAVTIVGLVSVKNVCFNKRVFLRLTEDRWANSRDVQATFRDSADGGRRDNFAFTFSCSCSSGGIGGGDWELQFCVGFEAVDIGQTFWDNNGGENYRAEMDRQQLLQQQQNELQAASIFMEELDSHQIYY